MTHGREKSDSAIVAGKPTNNVERSTAVPAEPRAEAEGNTSQQSTCRAQDRDSVSQALESIRKVVRERKKEIPMIIKGSNLHRSIDVFTSEIQMRSHMLDSDVEF